MTDPIHVYLGDAVYAEFDGFAINLRLNSHTSPVLIVLEPTVMANLIEFSVRHWPGVRK